MLLTQVLYTPVHSLIDQSLHARLGAETTNGDGFGLGWYDATSAPALARAIGFVEECGHARGIRYPFQGSIATTDGTTMWAFRYSSDGSSRSLFLSRDIRTVREECPGEDVLREAPDDARLVVSEPLGEMPGAWLEMPEATYGVVSRQEEQLMPFSPQPPSNAR